MSFADVVNRKSFSLVVRMDPPKGGDLAPLLDAALTVRGRVDATCFSDCPMAIMRMNPLAPCHLLQQKGMETVLNLNARDRNRLAIQSELLAAWALGVRSILLCEGDDPSFGDHPVTMPCRDLDLEGLLGAVAALKEGKDLAGQPVAASPSFHTGVEIQLSDDDGLNKKKAADLGRLAKLGVEFVFVGNTYDADTIKPFAEAAAGAGVKVFASIVLLKSLGMAKYLNSIKGVPNIPASVMQKITKAPIKQKACLEIAADFVDEIKNLCSGVVICPLGWEAKVPELLDLLQG
jgi:5,10-methylenetetrahydrofolate reductase